MSKETYDIVTEVGNFGEMGEFIDMDTVHPDAKKKKKSMEELIEESTKRNLESL